jgi:hypothetical protein
MLGRLGKTRKKENRLALGVLLREAVRFNVANQAFETRAARVDNRLDLGVGPALFPCKAARTAEGLQAAIVKRALAGPSGCRRPCSQF